MDITAIGQLFAALGVGGALAKLFDYLTKKRDESANDERTLRSELRTDLRELQALLAKHQSDLAASQAREAGLVARLEALQERLRALDAVETECDDLRTRLNAAERENLVLRMTLSGAGIPLPAPLSADLGSASPPPTAGNGG